MSISGRRQDQVIAIFPEPLHQVLRRGDIRMHRDLGRRVDEVGESPFKLKLLVGPHGVDGAEVKIADQLSPSRPDGAAIVLYGAEQVARRFENGAPLVGEGEAAAAAFA
jgi:hypothetical protein